MLQFLAPERIANALAPIRFDMERRLVEYTSG
jgi:hypothetical protein